MASTLSEYGLVLGRKLKSIYNEKTFVISILSIVQSDKDRNKMINYLESNPDADVEDITLFAMNLRREQEGYKLYHFEEND